MFTANDARLAFLGVVVQTVSALLLAATFVALRRFAPDRAYLRDWTRALVALSVALVAVVLRYQFGQSPLVSTWDTPPLVRPLLDTLYQGGKFAFFAWLLIGARRFADLPPRVPPIVLISAISLAGFLSAVVFSSLNTMVFVQAPIALATCLLAARAISHAPPARKNFGSRTSAIVLALIALLWLFYFCSFGLYEFRISNHVNLLSTLARYNSFIDVLLQMSLGFALVITLFQDIEREAESTRAERAALQARLAEAEKLEALGVLVSGVAHELNNPLTSIVGYGDLLVVDGRLPEELRDPVRTIAEQAQRCRTIVRGLLDAARQRRAPRVPVRLAELVARVVRGFGPQLTARRVRIAADLPRDLGEVAADSTGLEQVFSNLLANALEALSPGGQIRINARPSTDDRVALRFEDDGPGIAPELRNRIFEPFFTTKSQRKGTGLGLAISQRIVQAHGGTLTLAQREDGAPGAAFEILLPRHATAHGDTGTFPIPTARTDDPPTDVHGKPRVLIVDDEKPVRELLLRFLRHRGFSVREAADGREALALLESGLPIAALVTDLRMPGMGGIELFTQVQKRWPELARCTIAITGDVLTPEVANFVRRRVCPVLEKPLDLARLVADLTALTGAVTPASPSNRSSAPSA